MRTMPTGQRLASVAALLLLAVSPAAATGKNKPGEMDLGDLGSLLGAMGGKGGGKKGMGGLADLLGGLQGGKGKKSKSKKQANTVGNGEEDEEEQEQDGCKDNEVYIPKKDYRPAVNGCGPTGMRQRTGDKFELHHCCNAHDTCYAACGIEFEYCEQAFKKCMATKCKSVEEDGSCGTDQGGAPIKCADKCTKTASSFSSMTMMFGGGFFQSGIEEACECKPADEKAELLKDYLTFFYNEYAEDENSAAKKVAAIDATLAKYEGQEGYLLWKLTEAYPKYVDYLSEAKNPDNPSALTEEECTMTVTKVKQRSDEL